VELEVTICDHLALFSDGQLEPEIAGEAIGVPFDRLVKGLGRGAVQFRQIGVEDYLLSSDQQNPRLDLLDQDAPACPFTAAR